MKKLFFAAASIFILLMSFYQCSTGGGRPQILVFSKTEAFRHSSIPKGIAALKSLGAKHGADFVFTEDSEMFNENNLKKFNCVVFLNTTGDVLNDEQQYTFERYIQAGGGYAGIHAATDTEYDWPWYGELAGAWFLDHPSDPSNVQKGKFLVTQKDHWATKGMPDEFEKTDEFYSFKSISPNINVVLKIDEKSYKGGKNGDNHPMSWYREFDGGRSFYTALGHTEEIYDDQLFINHVWAGIHYAAGGDHPKALDYSKSKPEENRFSKVVMAEKLDEPMELSVLDDNRVLFIERKGGIKMYNIKTEELKTIAMLPVSTKYRSKEGKESEAEDGLLGLSKDPDFAKNHWIYLYYSTPEAPENVLARFEMKGDSIDMSSKKILLKVGVQREECCHTGGSIAWDKAGNLYLSTGDNTNPHGSNGYSPSDERPGRSPWDAQKSSANTNDLRGKIIRIKPLADGTYRIPEGNLFSPGTPQTRPEIYTMGHRNPFRISVDQKNGNLYWGEVGPDAGQPDSLRGPAGHDEIGQARKAGNFGWPHFVGDNKAYYKYDFKNNKSLQPWNAKAPTNTSPNNTGITTLPPAEKALVWYPYDVSPEFPLMGSGGRNAMAGPVYYADDFKQAPHAFPKYYDGKFFAYEWMRGFIMAITLDEEGNYKSMERFMPSYKFSNPMDMEFAANGDLYMLEYGTGWFTANDDARLVRIEYNGGNRNPQIEIQANRYAGVAPLNLELTSKGTKDFDNDELRHTWTITSVNGFKKEIRQPDVKLTLTENGVYNITYTADDQKGGVSTKKMEISVGNEPPSITLDLNGGNSSFYFANQPVKYSIAISDKEDGTLSKGIEAGRVAFTVDYLAEGYDKIAIAQGHKSADESTAFSEGKNLIEKNDCAACHKKDTKSIGPDYKSIATRYKSDKEAVNKLSKKIINGGGGVWGETVMAAHPKLTTAQATEMTKYILSLGAPVNPNALPLQGQYVTRLPKDDPGKGVFIWRVAYEDNPVNNIPAARSEQTLVMRNAKIDAHGFDVYKDVNKMSFGGMNLAMPAKNGCSVALKGVDLAGMKSLIVLASAPKPQANAIGGKIELRLNSPTGRLIGESEFLEASEKMDFVPKSLVIPIAVPAEEKGKKDVYVVFVNPKSTSQTMMVVVGFEFTR